MGLSTLISELVNFQEANVSTICEAYMDMMYVILRESKLHDAQVFTVY